jgi:hypothetical protein
MSEARNPWRLPAATFGLGVAALAGIISVTAPAAPQSGRDTETTTLAIVVASHDAPINLLAVRTSCTTPTTNTYCAF